MIAIDEALRRVLAEVPVVGAEEVALPQALGRTLAGDFIARMDQPSFDNSAMDGWAVRAAELPRASADDPTRLARSGESRAGEQCTDPHDSTLSLGSAMRIFTGAPLPSGADAVVLQEDTTWSTTHVMVNEAPSIGQHIRRRGSDFGRGDRLLAGGTVMGPGAIGLMASQGVSRVSVRRRPRVAIVSTGDELHAPGSPLPPHGIYDSNGPMLEALVAEAGGSPRRANATADDERTHGADASGSIRRGARGQTSGLGADHRRGVGGRP